MKLLKPPLCCAVLLMASLTRSRPSARSTSQRWASASCRPPWVSSRSGAVVGVEQDRCRDPLPQRGGDPDVVVVGVGAHDGAHLPAADDGEDVGDRVGALITTHSVPSPITHMLFSTSKVCPSRLNVPLDTA
jgi:hypothetical protein